MKRLNKILLITLAVAITLLTLAACNTGGDLSGMSAYEIAVKNGYEGTETEWLQSLHTTNTVEKTTNDYNVNVKDVNDVSVAANIGLKSIVSVYCKHTVTVNTWIGQSTKEAQSAGSGVLYQLESDGSAYVITNHHVLYEASSTEKDKISKDITLYLYGMEDSSYGITATYVGGSLNYDIAVLRVEKSEILQNAIRNGTACAVEFADSNKIRVGQTSIAIGNPEAEGISVTSGVVSVDSEYINMTAVDNRTKIQLRVIRTDTPVNSGNSGGGLFDGEGKLIGIVNAKAGDTEVENIAYAIPCNVAKAIADNIIDYSKLYNKQCVMRVMLGITVQVDGLSTQLDEQGYLVKTEKVTVLSVTDDSIVKGKLQTNDTILSVKIGDGEATDITRNYQFIDVLLNARVGDVITIGYMRNGVRDSVSITVPNSCLAEY